MEMDALSQLNELVSEMNELVRNYDESIRKRSNLQDQVDVLTEEVQRLRNTDAMLDGVIGDLKEIKKERDLLRIQLQKIENIEPYLEETSGALNKAVQIRGKLQDQVDVLSDEAFRLGNVEVYLEEVLSNLKEMTTERDTLRVLLQRIGTEEEDKKKVYVWDKGNGKHKGIAVAIASTKKEAYNAIKDKVQDVVGLPMFWYFMGTKPDKVFKIEDFGMLISWDEPKK